MDIEFAIREALADIADDAAPVDGLAITAIRRAKRRQYAARAAMAGTAAAVTIPAGIAVLHDPGPGSTASPASSGNAAPSNVAEPNPAEPDALPVPPAHDLDADELAAAFDICRRGMDGAGDGYRGWEPVFGITIDASATPGVPTTWVAARSGDDYRADCALDSSGQQVGGGGVYGLKSTPDLLYALVDGQEGDGVGRYVEPVARVTVQYQDEPEQEAVLRGGFWFFPIDETRTSPDDVGDPSNRDQADRSVEPPLADSPLIGVPRWYTFRGYNADGQLVYDSGTDGPSIDDCYADSAGSEFVGNGAGHSSPAECVTTHRWRPLP